MTIVKLALTPFCPAPVWTSNSLPTQFTLPPLITGRQVAQTESELWSGVTSASVVESVASMPLTPTQYSPVPTCAAYATPLLRKSGQNDTGAPHSCPPYTTAYARAPSS